MPSDPTECPSPDLEHGPVTEMLHRARKGDDEAMRDLVATVYDELRVIASRQRRRGASHETLDTGALVHEAFIKLMGQSATSFVDSSHFFAVAATAMRHLIVDYSRAKHSQKRGGDATPVTLERRPIADVGPSQAVLEIDEALNRLGQHSPDLVRVVECRYFGGMTEDETAEALGVSDRTVRRRWTKARAWLHRELA